MPKLLCVATPTDEKSLSDQKPKLPRAFIFRRLHSLLGIWLVLFLVEHLLVNSQASLLFGDQGALFVKMVNKIHDLPFLPLIEITLLGIPFLLHGAFGIRYALTSRLNSLGKGGRAPALPQYKRNRAFSWQRITSWLLIIGIIGHVVQMRFLRSPDESRIDGQKRYVVSVSNDPALDKLASFYGATLSKNGAKVEVSAPSAGAAFLLVVRDTFKSPLMVVLYSFFVISAAYHAFNGLWTALVSWGVLVTRRAQQKGRYVTTFLMWLVMIFGLMACWGPYWTMVWS